MINAARSSSKAINPTISNDTDRHHFFASLANVITSIEQDKQGILPTGLQTGPNIEVRSFNKKQRPTVTQFKTRPRPESRHAQVAFSTTTPAEKPAHALSQEQPEYHTTEKPHLPQEAVQVDEPPNIHESVALDSPERTEKATHAIQDIPKAPTPPHHHDVTETPPSPSLELIEHPTDTAPNTRKNTNTVPERPQDSTTIKLETAKDILVNPRQGHAQADTTPPTILAAPTTTRKTKRDKEPQTTVAALVGPRKRRAVVPETHVTINETKDAKTKVVIDLDSDGEGDDSSTEVNNSTTRTGLTTSIFSAAPISSSTTSTSTSKPLKRATTRAGSAGPLAEVCVYVIPTNMNKDIFNLSRKRVLELRGEWVGPKSKVLTPHVKDQMPPLDPRTTHIVTTLSNLEAVKKALKTDFIDPKIAIVKNEWLADSIQFKKPMETKAYSIGVTIPAFVRANTDSTPRSSGTPPMAAMLPPSNKPGANTDSSKVLNFQDIVQGLQEGSLDDADLSDIHGSDDDDKNNGHPQKKKALESSSSSGKPVASGESSSKGPPSPSNESTEEEKVQLHAENRCFYCREPGHWASTCHRKKMDGKQIDKDQVLLQIINSGKAVAHKNETERRPKILYQCQSPHVAGEKQDPAYNKAIIEQLTTLMSYYDKIKTKGSKENFKVINYRKAITAIRALDYEIKSEEMALKVPRVGKKIAQKIGECISLGQMKKLSHLDWDKERSQVETLFRSVYGVGSEKATEWYNKGLRTLDDLRKLPDLTQNQKSGLKYYHDLLVRIPRAEVEQIGLKVETSAKNLHPDIQSHVTGSYRRGRPDCGDVDIVVARPNIDRGEELYQIMEHILHDLKNQGFLVDDLSVPYYVESMADGLKHFKYMGICRLPGANSVHHHIDILVVPWMHLGAVLIYFTGNDICNRSMRLLAANRGMRLSDKGLFAGVLRGPKRKRVNEGHWVAGRTEKEIFDYLKIKYLEPHEREC
ncbi:hypothetical protein BG006_008937 [Podila minutissima]|uniref:DNA polymerase lambda n=1 Tax=Podila minutissima TaxID=64525 RepID=A0A9P5VJQ6_9FUNG|nr:hypothetical protein BG006_008937 [Podila minutissima]